MSAPLPHALPRLLCLAGLVAGAAAHARKRAWEACFRIHNTGRPSGQTTRKDYAEVGQARMRYYDYWVQNRGNIFSLSK